MSSPRSTSGLLLDCLVITQSYSRLSNLPNRLGQVRILGGRKSCSVTIRMELRRVCTSPGLAWRRNRLVEKKTQPATSSEEWLSGAVRESGLFEPAGEVNLTGGGWPDVAGQVKI